MREVPGTVSGLLIVDKPAGWTSHDVVGKVRRLAGTRRVGHAGTLDPMATGVLVVLVGRATRAAEFAEAQVKGYRAHIRFGVTTDTLDTEGNVLSSGGGIPEPDALRAILPRFTGEIEQIPPMYSAIKVGGRKLYEIARAGGEVERNPRQVNITRLDFAGQLENGDCVLDVECSKGTYIRTLCADIGEALGCGACMSALRRTYSGGFRADDALTLGEIEHRGARECLLPVDTLFAGHAAITMWSERAERAVRNGSDVTAPQGTPDGTCRVYAQNGEFLMLGEVKDGVLHTIKSFFEV